MRPVHLAVSVSVVFISAVSLAAPARAATLCVNTSGKQGCYTSISAAVSAASAGDTITVAPGTYSEQVTITKPLSLVGDNRENTIIAANGHSNGIHVDGFTAPGLAHVVITGFTVQDANFEGILIQNTSAATVSENIVRHNDQNLQIQNGACPGLPAFETNEGDDCGEGIHLMGVDHSTIACNNVELNAGGILVSDETASNHLPATRKELSRHLLSVEMPPLCIEWEFEPHIPIHGSKHCGRVRKWHKGRIVHCVKDQHTRVTFEWLELFPRGSDVGADRRIWIVNRRCQYA